ncbi:MAG TPA: [FeFe] hydrogenase H-cluster radical SAM maturase HydG [Bacteroidales bacterium]|nr:[FeFe] hydrogenase H-cluster radical SAM maturase HydG [Bacteroidales bacterium]
MATKETWAEQVIKQDEIDKYLINGKDFIDEQEILSHLEANKNPDKQRIRDIMQKSLAIERLNPDEVAALLAVDDEDLLQEMYETALEVKRKVYDNRIVFFAPLYCSNLCVNSCLYCGFRKENTEEKRRILTMDEVREETRIMTREGHKRMIIVFGEHQRSNADYMVESIKAAYSVQEKSPKGPGVGNIRRINVNAAPMEISELKKLWEAGIGTYQVFQETYHKPTYKNVHPAGPKSNYQWRLYALHRAMEAGIDDVATGALFGVYDWKFEVMGLLYHAMDLERQFGIGPHTISFPRLTPASGSKLSTKSKYLVSDKDMKKIVAILRLAVPYTGLICTVREKPETHTALMTIGCTQTDASSNIGIGGYTDALKAKALAQAKGVKQIKNKQQFILNDTRSLDEMIREMAKLGMISSFCTAGYRCGRTGDKIMGLLKSCTEGKFCKLNAVLTFREFLDDYASDETREIGFPLIDKELAEIKEMPFYQKGKLHENFLKKYEQISNGERDIYI